MTTPDKPTIEKLQPGDPDTQTADVISENVSRLKALFPELVTEGKDGASVNMDVLKQLVGDATVTDCDEKFGLNWHGKRHARQLALTPSTGTLRPCPEESVDWDTTQNLFIEGDNLEVLKLLQKSYSSQVKLIYIDPPYNTGNDFVYPDDFRDNLRNYLTLTSQVSGDGGRLSSNPESSGRFHTRWLNMMYPRLRLARDLLRNDGVICISIDDTEQAHLKSLCNDVLGEENHIATIVWQKRYVSNVTAKWLSDMHDFIYVYARNRDAVSVKAWERTAEQLEAYRNPDDDPRGVWRAQDLSASKPYSAGQFTITGPTGKEFDPPPNRYWRCNRDQFEKWKTDNRIWWGVNGDARPMLKSFLQESERGVTPHTWWDYGFAGHNKEATLELKQLFDGDAPFDTPKPVKLMTRLLDLFCARDDIVMDFFCGSGTLGHAAIDASVTEQLRFIMVQYPEPTDRPGYATLAAIAQDRLRRAGDAARQSNPMFTGDVGFRVFKLDSSNIREWEPSREDIAESLEAHVENLRTNRTEQDILYELLLKRGLDLCVPIETKEIAGKTVHSIGAGTLFACLSESITPDEGEPVALGIVAWHQELDPAGDTTVVFRDSAFADDVVKTNVAAILDQSGLKNVRSL